jgi:hypothetical protein
MPSPDQKISFLRSTLLPASAGVALLLFVTAIAAGLVAGPKHERSTLDGRPLSDFPEPAVASIRDGSWMAGVESWIDDHVPARSRWLNLHGTLLTKGLQVPVVGDVLVDDPAGMQLQKPPQLRLPPSLAGHARQLGEDVRAQGVPMLWVYAPRKEEVFADRLPEAWPHHLLELKPRILEAMSQGGPTLDLTSALNDPERRDSYFWRTDHHWTPAGAMAAIDAIAEKAGSLGVEIPADERPLTPVDYGTFYGSTARKVTPGATAEPDQFVIPTPPEWRARICRRGTCDRPTLVTSAARHPDPYYNRYRAFLGGDFGYQRIESTDPEATGTILLLKDSYGDALSVYLAERVKTLVTIDERHYRGKDVRELVAEVKPDLVMVMHNPVTMLGNRRFHSVAWVDVAAAVERRRGAPDGDG